MINKEEVEKDRNITSCLLATSSCWSCGRDNLIFITVTETYLEEPNVNQAFLWKQFVTYYSVMLNFSLLMNFSKFLYIDTMWFCLNLFWLFYFLIFNDIIIIELSKNVFDVFFFYLRNICKKVKFVRKNIIYLDSSPFQQIAWFLSVDLFI